MFDKLLTNRYFCIAIIIALLVVLYLYSQRTSCEVEGMQNINLTPLAQELTETPWTNDPEGGNYKKYNNKFDKFADLFTKEKLKKNGYAYTNFLERDDRRYLNYAKKDGDEEVLKSMGGTDAPKPLDSSKAIKQYQEYRHPKNKLLSTDDDDEDSSESDERKEKIYHQIQKMMYKLQKMGKNKKKYY